MTSELPILTPHITGSASGETLFFVQGWPDDHTVWDDQIASLRGRYRCVRVDLPNYPTGEQRRWGFDHEAIAEALAACICSVSPDRPVTLIAHDWGAYWSYILHHRHPELVARLVGLDVPPWVEAKPHEALVFAAYQLWLVAALVCGNPVGDWMTQLMAAGFGAPPPRAAVRAKLNYPYLYTFRDVISGRFTRQLRDYRPEAPVLYVYGERKPLQFNCERWLQTLRSQPGSAVVALAESGHWVMKDPDFTRVLTEWLERSVPEVLAPEQAASLGLELG